MSSAAHHVTCHHRQCYLLTCEEFDALYAYAEGKCQICRIPEAETTRGRLVIDHAGHYGQRAVRGLLCDRCNNLMGKVDAGKVIDERCIRYRYGAWFIRVLADRRVSA